MIGAWYAPEWLTMPMRQLLEWFTSVTGSYGISIILLTVVVRIVILPLTIYQMKSMKRMQEVQPRMKALQEKHKENPQKLNEEMMALYKSEGVNPFAGCLPLLVQMPFLYAIFAVLNSGAGITEGVVPTFLWIQTAEGLLAPDPFYILPILTVISMFVQSYLSGQGNDPNQKMMMYMLPLVFGFMTFKMPSGVVLYWVVSTIFGLVQQSIYPGFPRFKGGPAAKGEA